MWTFLLALPLAFGADFYVETTAVTNREEATAIWDKARASGLSPRIVRRFRLGHGWEFVVQVDGFANEADATGAATALANAVGLTTTIYREEERQKPVPVPATAEAEAPAVSASAWIARADEALGGPAGGAQALGRAGAVHFTFTRTFAHGAGTATVEHDYWRQGGYRKLGVSTGGIGQDSVAYVTPTAAWIKVGGATTSRDIGVAVGAVDGFAPEAVLTLALEAHRLLAAPESRQFTVLEGAESGIRLGVGADAPDLGLTWVDLDPATGRLSRARYVTDAGPVEWELSEWQTVGHGVVVPRRVRMVRADGGTEEIRVTKIEVLDKAPEGTFPSAPD